MLSAVIIAYNEEINIGRCLQSLVGIADEIIVVDSCSTDKTCLIAEQYGAIIIQHPFVGFAAQKNYAAQCATHNWVLSLDADEVLSEELKSAILQVKNKAQFEAYFLKRTTNFCGTFIRHGSWYPDKQCRLWDKTKVTGREPYMKNGAFLIPQKNMEYSAEIFYTIASTAFLITSK